MFYCWSCKKELEEEDIRLLQRVDSCNHCKVDLRVCLNCRFWDPRAGMCREGIRDFVRDREKANFCGQFFFADRQPPELDAAEEAKARLQSLFKKL